MAEIHLLGIRHHGPGSTRRLLEALKKLQPDALAIELPDETNAYERYLFNSGIRLPVAIWINDPKNAQQSSLLPFSEFSPEYQALKYANQFGIAVEKIDLPSSIYWEVARKNDVSEKREDYLGELAKMSGFSGFESWWDHYFERESDSLKTFQYLLEIMEIARKSVSIHTVEKLREGYMREKLRKLMKKYERIAVITGAWHSPMLTLEKLKSLSGDKALLKGVKKKKVNITLIPYSYSRLSKYGGYGSGVQSPTYYAFLYKDKINANMYWLTHCAHELRSAGFNCSADEVGAAVETSNSLAQMRGLTIPGLRELKDACLSAMCKGRQEKWEVIEKNSIIGSKIGYVPHELLKTPLLDDFYKKIKSFRIRKFWQKEEVYSSKNQKELDLRKELHLACSHFLHRLKILGLDWAYKTVAQQKGYSTFKENWYFHWDLEDEIKLHEVSALGANIKMATEKVAVDKIASNPSLEDTILLLQLCIKANCHGVFMPLIEYLHQIAAQADDLHTLIQANTSLIRARQYDLINRSEIDLFEPLIDRIHSKISHLLAFQHKKYEEEQSDTMLSDFAQYHQLLLQTNEIQWIDRWLNGMLRLVKIKDNDARLNGFALRICLDFDEVEAAFAYDRLDQHLNNTFDPLLQAAWLQGFLTGGAMVLLYHMVIFKEIRNWVKTIHEDTFEDVLPILNRLFSSYSQKDREAILKKLKVKKSETKDTDFTFDGKDYAEKNLALALEFLNL